MSKSLRFNLLDIERFDSADDGKSGVLTAIVRHPGVLRYAEPNGGYRGELVTRDFNRKLDSSGLPLVRAIAGKAATNEHVPVQFDGDTPVLRDGDAVGRVREDGIHVYTDGRVRVTMDVDDEPTIQDIVSGKKKGLSLAYMCGTERKDGVHNGRPYQYIQTEPLSVHHVAIVENPRAPEATFLNFKFDSAETADIAWQVDSVEPIQQSASAENSAQPTGKQPMSYTLTVGNRPIVLDSADDAAAINALLADFNTLKTKLDAKKMADDEYDDGDDEEPDDDEDDEDMKGGKKMPPWMKKKMAKKDSAIADLQAHIDSLNSEIGTKDAELMVLQAIVGRTDSEEEPTEHNDAEAIATEVQARLDAMFAAYADAQLYLPADFKLDSSSTPESIQLAALSSLGDDFKLDSDEPAAIAGAYATMKRFAVKRQDSSNQLQTVLYQTLPNPTAARQDAAPRTIAELARLDSNDPALASLDFRTLAQVQSYRAGRQPINPGAN